MKKRLCENTACCRMVEEGPEHTCGWGAPEGCGGTYCQLHLREVPGQGFVLCDDCFKKYASEPDSNDDD